MLNTYASRNALATTGNPAPAGHVISSGPVGALSVRARQKPKIDALRGPASQCLRPRRRPLGKPVGKSAAASLKACVRRRL